MELVWYYICGCKNRTKELEKMIDVELLLKAISDAGYTISTFAEALGISRSTLWRKIYGKSTFDLDEVQKAAKVLDLEDPRKIFLLGEF